MKHANEPPRAADRCSDSAEAGEILDDRLVAYDERLRRRGALGDFTDTAPVPDEPLPPEELASCLRLLQRAWPRANGNSVAATIPQRIGRFEIERVLGAGGFGVVYLARDPLLHRLVALKVPRPHLMIDEGLRKRFRREAYAAAKLDHPHIVPIYETADEGPIGYIAAAYCPGPTLAEWLKEHAAPVPIRLAASLVACLADAVQYSHDQGVLHRDLKPGNVILMPLAAEDSPTCGDLPFNPRLTDFGLAKLREEGLEQATLSAVLGTPSYMAPEQSAAPYQVGVPADVYALGVILYELLAGRAPFVGDSIVEVLDQVRREEPVSLRRLRREVPRDLETACLKCLEKSPARRYGTARELAEDLRRFLAGNPLRARPPGPATYLLKWVRRQPLAAALVATLAIAAVTISSMLILHNQRLVRLTGELDRSLNDARGLKGQAEQAARLATRTAYASAMRLADLAWHDGDIRQCRLLLAQAEQFADAESPPGLEWSRLDIRTRADFREVGEALGTMFCAAVSPSGQQIAVGGEAGVVQIIHLPSGRAERILHTSHDDVRGVAYTRQGDRLAVWGELTTVSVWDVASGDCLFVSKPAPRSIKSVVWLLDDQWLAASGDFPSVRLWKVSAEQETADLRIDEMETIRALAVTHDGRRICGGGSSGSIWFWDASTREQTERRLGRGDADVSCLQYAAADELLAVGINDRRVDLYRVTNGMHTFVRELPHLDDPRSLSFSRQGGRLAVLEQFGTLRLWRFERPPDSDDIHSRFEQGWLAHEERGSQAAFLPSGDQLVSVGRGSHRPRVWSLSRHPIERSIHTNSTAEGLRLPILFSPDATLLIASHEGPRVWSTMDLSPLATYGEQRASREVLGISRDGRWLAAAANKLENVVELWDLNTGNHDRPLWRRTGESVNCLSFSPTGELLAAASWRDDVVLLLDRASGKRLQALPARQCHQVAFSPDGRHLAVDELDDVVIWDTSTWQTTARLKGHLSSIQALAFSPDGCWLASAGRDREIRLWDAVNWTPLRNMPGHRSDVVALRWTSSSGALISLDAGYYIKIWDPASGLELGNLNTPRYASAFEMAISPDSRYLAIRAWAGHISLERLLPSP